MTDGEILAGIFTRLRKMYAEEGGPTPEPVLNMTWNYSTPHEPASEEVAMESNGKALADIIDPATGAVIVKKGQQLSSFAQLRDDGTTSSGCWIFAGSWTPEGNQMARRDNADPSGLGNTLGWAWAWPLNRRILYNRASADPQGKPWDPKRQLLKWDGAKWGGVDIPDYSAAALAATSVRLSCSLKGWGVCSLSIRWLKGRSRNTTNRLKRRWGLTRCIQTWSLTRPLASLKAISSRWARPKVPVRRHHLPPDRALPLLDQTRAA